MKKTTGGNIDTSDDAFKKYDANGDGSLGEDELKSVMDAGRSGSTQGPPPPPPPDQSASSSSSSLQDQISLLRDLLEKLSKTGNSDNGTSSLVSVTT